MSILKFSLPEEEKPLLVIKMHWTTYFKVVLKFLIFGTVLGLTLFFVSPFWWEGSVGRIGLILFFLMGFLYLAFSWWKMALTNYIITPCRIIDITQEKILKRMITEIPIEEIAELKIKTRSKLESFLGRGSLIIKIIENKGVLVLYDIPRPEEALLKLEKLKNETKEIVEKEKLGCSVVIENNKEQKIPLTYSYFGEKGKTDKDLNEKEKQSKK